MFPALPAQASVAWYSSAWDYRQKISVNYSKVPNSDQTEFPVYLDLSLLSDVFFDEVSASGADILITKSDGTTKLPRELVSLDSSSKTGEIWFKADLSHLTTTDFYIYFGNTLATESNSTDVWDNGYLMVQHMNTDPTTSAPQALDSTINSSNGISGGSMTSLDLVSGAIGNAIDFDGFDDRYNLGNAGVKGLSQITYSSWINVQSGTDTRYIALERKNGSTRARLQYYVSTGNTVVLDIEPIEGSQTGRTSCVSSTTLTNGTWYYATASIDLNLQECTIYINGLLDKFEDNGSTSSTISNTNPSSSLIGDQTNAMSGRIDELRLSNLIRTEDWVMTEYNNQSEPNNFFIFGAVELRPKIIFNLINHLTPIKTSDWITDVSSEGQLGIENIAIKNSNFVIADLDVDFFDDQNWSLLNADAKPGEVFFDYPGGFSAIPGAVGDGFNLYITKENGTRVGICPGISSFNELSINCDEYYELTESDSQISHVTIDGIEYWRISGLTGTGAFTINSLADTGDSYFPSIYFGILTLILILKLGFQYSFTLDGKLSINTNLFNKVPIMRNKQDCAIKSF